MHGQKVGKKDCDEWTKLKTRPEERDKIGQDDRDE